MPKLPNHGAPYCREAPSIPQNQMGEGNSMLCKRARQPLPHLSLFLSHDPGPNKKKDPPQRVRRHSKESRRRPSPKVGSEVGQVLKTEAVPPFGRAQSKETTKPSRKKRCIFHNSSGHNTLECLAFNKMTVGEKEQWIL